MGLFLRGNNIRLSSGGLSPFKIECDALTVQDIETAAFLISRNCRFREVISVPTGGDRLAEALRKYATANVNDPVLIVDDVLTTGKSIEFIRSKLLAQGVKHLSKFIGWVIFARGKCPDWVTPVFQMCEDQPEWMSEPAINELVARRDRMLDEKPDDLVGDEAKRFLNSVNEIEEIVVGQFRKYFDNFPCDFIIETMTKFGLAPSVMYDDNGSFAITGEGYQEVLPEGKKLSGVMETFVDEDQWKPTIRQALRYYIDKL